MNLSFKQLKATALIGAVSLTLFCQLVNGSDWTEYRGPQHNGTTDERVQTAWPVGGPRVLWTTPLNKGFSSFAIGGGKAFTLVKRNIGGTDREVCIALDATSGKELWSHPIGLAKYDFGYDAAPDDGPRSTPAYDDGRVYVLSANLLLECLNANDGKVIWSRDLIKQHAGRNISWQNAASPIIDGNLVFVAGGGSGQSLLGVHKLTGNVVWKGQDEKITHATPVAATLQGVRQVVFLMQSGLVSVAPLTGQVLWRFKVRYNTSTAVSPVIGDDMVYCSAGYGVGAIAARISRTATGWKATELWRKPGNKLANQWSTPVYHDGHIYGLFGVKEYGEGPLKCVEMATGEEKWSRDGFGPGNLILAANALIALTDQGEVVLVEPSFKGYSELARKKLLEGKCWSMPALSGGRIFARSSKEGACLDAAVRNDILTPRVKR